MDDPIESTDERTHDSSPNILLSQQDIHPGIPYNDVGQIVLLSDGFCVTKSPHQSR
jgi:hypothetical protein